MTGKKRKSLDDSLANEFVFGGDKTEDKPLNKQEVIEQSVESTPEFESVSASTEKEDKELSLMEKLQVEAKEGTKRFTIDLAESMHRKLSILAAKTGRSKADIVRMVLDDLLEDVEE